MTDGERKEIFSEIVQQSKKRRDFYVMVVLSAIIAAFGLIFGNIAVIIGAMLIAPMMEPLIGIALAITLGEMPLLKRSIYDEVKAFSLVVLIAALFAAAIPMPAVSSEVLLRAKPTIVDIVLALTSGAAAAYAIARRKNATLPGVAIAVSILPPVSVVGIGIALQSIEIMVGAFLLFLANIVAIVLSGFIVFWLAGFAPERIHSGFEKKDMMKKVRNTSFLLALIAIPLTVFMYQAIDNEAAKEKAQRIILREIAPNGEIEKLTYLHKNGKIDVGVTLLLDKELSEEKYDSMKKSIEDELKHKVDLKLRVKMTQHIG